MVVFNLELHHLSCFYHIFLHGTTLHCGYCILLECFIFCHILSYYHILSYFIIFCMMLNYSMLYPILIYFLDGNLLC